MYSSLERDMYSSLERGARYTFILLWPSPSKPPPPWEFLFGLVKSSNRETCTAYKSTPHLVPSKWFTKFLLTVSTNGFRLLSHVPHEIHLQHVLICKTHSCLTPHGALMSYTSRPTHVSHLTYEVSFLVLSAKQVFICVTRDYSIQE